MHNGHDQDGVRSLTGELKLAYPLTVLPGIYGGVETNMAVADGVVYVPVANLASVWKTRDTGLGAANFSEGTGEMVALGLADRHRSSGTRSSRRWPSAMQPCPTT